MKARYLLSIIIVVSIAIPSFLQAQEADTCRQFVQYRTGNKVCYNLIEQKGSFSILADGRKISLSKVDIFVTGSGYYVLDRSSGYGGVFKRIVDGNRIALFNQFTTNAYTTYNPGFGVTMNNSSSNRYIYQKDAGPLTKFKIKNLKLDLADNAKSMHLLKQASNTSKLQAGLYAVAITTIIIGTVQTFNSVGDPSSGPDFSPLIFVGAGLSWVPYFIGKGKHKKLRMAVEVYNN